MAAIVYDFLVSLAYPPMLSLCLLLCAAIAAALRRRALGGALAACALGWSLLWSIPWVSQWLRTTLEDRHPIVAEAALPEADAIVVLGGGRYGRWSRRERIDPDELRNSRLAAGARAWLAGRAPLIILSGGNGGGGESEADRMAATAVRMGVPASALILEENSGDTRANARLTAALAQRRGMRRLLLVTSSVHMPRARLLFDDAGVDVFPVPVPDAQLGEGWRARWLPTPRALWRSGRALKEYGGLLVLHARARFAGSSTDSSAG